MFHVVSALAQPPGQADKVMVPKRKFEAEKGELLAAINVSTTSVKKNFNSEFRFWNDGITKDKFYYVLRAEEIA